jgi:hypothetical protein
MVVSPLDNHPHPSPFPAESFPDYTVPFEKEFNMSTAPTTPTPEDPALYESRAGVPIAVVSTVLAISTAAVGLRSYCRAVIVRQFGVDDWAAVAALLLAIGSGITIAAGMVDAFPQASIHH